MIRNKRLIQIDNQPEFLSESTEETFELGKRLATALTAGDVVALYGNLGAGKTCLIQGICAGLNVDDYVTSPSFTIINEYNGDLPVYHFDFYRLSDVDELYDLGLTDYFYGNGVCLIEWPQIAEDFLPEDTKIIRLEFVNEDGSSGISGEK